MSAAPASARLFAALELPEPMRSALGEWGARAEAGDPALRAVDPAQLHLTLHFLGERPLADLPALRAAIVAAPGDGVRLRTAGALWLAPRAPHVLSCAIEDVDGAAGRLHAVLGTALASASAPWTPERRPLRPHVTVARVRRGARPHREVPAPPEAAGWAPALVLVRSHLGPGGARHEVLACRPLRSGS